MKLLEEPERSSAGFSMPVQPRSRVMALLQVISNGKKRNQKFMLKGKWGIATSLTFPLLGMESC